MSRAARPCVLDATFVDAALPDDEQTSLHPQRFVPPPQESVAPPPLPRGFVLAPGGRIGKYELRSKLGQGTFGLVFVARDLELDRDVAIKLLNPTHLTNAEIHHRFLQEARASARISHPGIVTVLDCGKAGTELGECAYIVLELLQGESLTSRLGRSGKLAPDTAVEVARQIASAIAAAHRADVLHRDLKPDNVYLVPDPAVPAGERVKVLDFGLARIGASRHTMMNTVFGTPRYMSPEQCRSAAMIDHRSDIYSLGCILFELVTGHTPFEGDLRALVEGHQRVPAPRARQLAPEISASLDDLIACMLAKDPADRPQSMIEVQSALQHQGAVSPGVAVTLPPFPAQLIALPEPARDESGVLLVPPIIPFDIPDTARVRHRRPRRGRKTPVVAAAIAFCVAAALTALAIRGNTPTAAAAPSPAAASIPGK